MLFRRLVHGRRHLDLDTDSSEDDEDEQSKAKSKLTLPESRAEYWIYDNIWTLEDDAYHVVHPAPRGVQTGGNSGMTVLMDLQACASYDRE